MNCRDYQQMINRLIDLELKATASAELFDHLGECAQCREFFEALTKLNLEIEKAQVLTEPPQITGRAWSHTKPVVKSTPATYVSAFVRHRISVPAPIATAVAVAFLVLVFLMQEPQARKQIAAVREAPPVQITTLPVVKLP